MSKIEQDEPKSTTFGKQKMYSLQDNLSIIYNIKLTYASDKLIVDIEQEDSFPKISYSSTFILKEIQKYDKWFRLFDTFNESLEIIDGLFVNKKVKIIKQEKSIDLIFSHFEKYVSDSAFTIEKKEEPEEKDGIVAKILESQCDLRNRIKILEKINNELKEKIDTIISIPKIAQIFAKGKKNFLEGIIKDEEDKNLIFSWINKDIDKISAKLIYSAKIDGDDSLSFHYLCDNIGPNLVIVESVDGKIFGGYTRENWSGNNQYKADEKAFIFHMDIRRKGELSKKENSIYCSPNLGPTFGGDDLRICSECLKINGSYFRPSIYKFKIKQNNNNLFNNNLFQSNISYSYLDVNYTFQCKNVEVYSIIEN